MRIRNRGSTLALVASAVFVLSISFLLGAGLAVVTVSNLSVLGVTLAFAGSVGVLGVTVFALHMRPVGTDKSSDKIAIVSTNSLLVSSAGAFHDPTGRLEVASRFGGVACSSHRRRKLFMGLLGDHGSYRRTINSSTSSAARLGAALAVLSGAHAHAGRAATW
jgi:hypothetical protein